MEGRNLRYHILFLLYVILFVFNKHCPNLYAQATDNFTRLSINEGLSQSAVRVIIQDNEGYMWFGTQDGLNKYDGYNFTIYKNDINDASSISNNEITTIVEDKEGNLWIGTHGGGINKLDRTTGNFTKLLHEPGVIDGLTSNFIEKLFIDSLDRLWIISSKEVHLFDLNHKEFMRFESKDLFRDNKVECITETLDGTIWLGTANGLFKMDSKTGKFLEEELSFSDSQGSLGYVSSIYTNKKENVLWIGHKSGKIIRYDIENKHLKSYDVESPVSSTQITEDRDDNLWLSYWGEGIVKLNKETGEITKYKHDQNNYKSLSYDTIWTVFVDRGNLLWVGTYGKGINKLNLNTPKFKLMKRRLDGVKGLSNNSIRQLYYENGVLWIGTYGGLNKYNTKMNTFTYFPAEGPPEKALGNVYSITPDRDNDNIIWLGNEVAGLYQFFKDSQSVVLISKFDEVYDVFSIVDDGEGHLWLGTWKGLKLFDKKKKVFTDELPGLNHEEIYQDVVGYVYQDSKGVLWYATKFGLHKYDYKKGVLKVYRNDPKDSSSISYNSIKCIYEDEHHNLWIGTEGGGINKMNINEETFVSYTTADGLPNNVIYGILEDEEGYLWLSTNKGLSKFDTEKRTFKNYTVEDGLQSNEFNSNSFYKASNGILYFGGIEGLTYFNPSEVKENTYIPSIVITSFKKFDDEINYKQILADDNEVKLTYKDKFISFEFASLDFNSPNQNQYAYRLEGLDEEWTYSGTRRFVSYTNLEPGYYVFRVKGTNNDGIWNETGTAIPLYIQPPFWKELWFILLMGLLGIAIIYIIFKARLNKVRLESEKLRIEGINQMLQQQNEEKGAMLKEVHHRVKNNLQVVNSLLKFQSRKIEDEHILEMFKEAQNRVLSMALLHEKMYKTEDLKHINTKEHLTLLVEDLVKNYVVKKKIMLNIDIDDIDLGIEKLVPIGLIVNEIITNSLKYAFKGRKKGKLMISLNEEEPDKIVLKIGDDGVGFDSENKGRGLGTRLIQMFTKQLNATLKMTSISGTFYEISFNRTNG